MINRIDSLLHKYKVAETEKLRLKYCKRLAEFLLKNSNCGDNQKNISLYEFEGVAKKYNGPRSLMYYSNKHRVTLNNARWYIHNHYNCKNKVWNGSFLHGFSKSGKLSWNGPALRWSSPKYMYEVLQNKCPFGGNFNYERREFYWTKVPAFYLPCNRDTYSYLAGLLSCASVVEHDGHTYGSVNTKIRDELVKFGIPIEVDFEDWYFASIKIKKHFISPIWPVLFSDFMPENIWSNVKKPYMAEEYASLLWFKYIGSYSIEKDAIPFLKSRRHHFYKYKDIKGDYSMADYLERQIVKKDLVSLDGIFKDLIHEKISGEKVEKRYQHRKVLN